MHGRVQQTKSSNSRSQNRIRIIGGLWRSRIIEFPDVLGLRPTPDRVRETLFNWLGQNMAETHCLDLFAGSGVLGFEAASRGAHSVTLVESARPAIEALRRNQERLGASQCQIIAQDAIKVLEILNGKFDVIFIDPPFSSDYMPAVLSKLGGCLNPGGRVYAEWREPLAKVVAQFPGNGWTVLRSGQAGAVHFALLSQAEIPPISNEVAT
jgi:16S rRNA (guanine966-N2)-methyltransferase